MKKSIEALQNKLDILNNELNDTVATIKEMQGDALTYFETEITDQYDDMLNECYECELFCNIAYALQQTDPTAYRCGLLDYAEGIDLDQFSDYTEQKEQRDTLESDIYDLECEIEEIEEN